MDLLVFGHAGARVLVFPTSQGRFFEWEDRGMVAALGEHLRQGWVQLFCVDSVDAESWYAEWKHPADRARRHEEYERYLLDEVLPLSQAKNPNPFLMATGASFGAYHAANIAFRNPHRFHRMIGLSGLYDVTRFGGGFYHESIFRNNPAHFISHEHDSARIAALQRMDIILATGAEDAFVENNRYMSGALWGKGIGNALRIWDGWAHDWPWWTRMIAQYIGGSD